MKKRKSNKATYKCMYTPLWTADIISIRPFGNSHCVCWLLGFDAYL